MSLVPALITLLKARVIVRFQLGAARGTPVRHEPAYFAVGSPLLPLKTIGIIDDGCCLAHESFRNAHPTSRFLFVWDQSPRARFSAMTPWNRFEHFASSQTSYGAELIGSDIDKFLKRHPDVGEANERALYRDIDRAHWGDPGRIHGACVLHALAGPRTMPLPPIAASPPGSVLR